MWKLNQIFKTPHENVWNNALISNHIFSRFVEIWYSQRQRMIPAISKSNNKTPNEAMSATVSWPTCGNCVAVKNKIFVPLNKCSVFKTCNDNISWGLLGHFELHHPYDVVSIRWVSVIKKDITPLLMHWSYVFLTLTHRLVQEKS